MRQALKFSFGSAIVYALIAACSASSEGRAARVDSGGSGGSSFGGESGAAGSLLDALIDPVPEANAAASPAIEVSADCTLEVPVGGGSPAMGMWAEASFPGKTAAELTEVVVYRETVTVDQGPPGYTHRLLATTFVRDGKAAALCGYKGDGISIGSLTFRLPSS